jgi:hypothetical protein
VILNCLPPLLSSECEFFEDNKNLSLVLESSKLRTGDLHEHFHLNIDAWNSRAVDHDLKETYRRRFTLIVAGLHGPQRQRDPRYEPVS